MRAHQASVTSTRKISTVVLVEDSQTWFLANNNVGNDNPMKKLKTTRTKVVMVNIIYCVHKNINIF